MPVKGGSGGANTSSGLHFEKKTSLKEAFLRAGFSLEGNDVHKDSRKIGTICSREKVFYALLDERSGFEPGQAKRLLSKHLKPDEAFLNFETRTIYIIEKKFQEKPGSVDEKPQTVRFKQRQYGRLTQAADLNVEYFFLFNCWYANPKYDDMLEYIESEGSAYFFNDIPLAALGIDLGGSLPDPGYCSEHHRAMTECAIL